MGNFRVSLNTAISVCSVQAGSVPEGIAVCFRVSFLKVTLVENKIVSQFKARVELLMEIFFFRKHQFY